MVDEVAHEEWESLAALAALDGLSPSEQAQLDAHLAECEACRTVLHDYQRVAQQLPFAVPQVQAPPELKGRILDAMRREPQRTLQPQQPPQQPQPAPTKVIAPPVAIWRRPLAWAAVAALLVAMVLGGQNFALRRQLADAQAQNTALTQLLGTPGSQPLELISYEGNAGEGAGRFVWAPGHPVGALVVNGLPQVPEGKTYQFWLIRQDGTVDNGGLFEVDDAGCAYLPVDAPSPWSTYKTMWITQEPEGGSPEPTGEWMLDGDF